MKDWKAIARVSGLDLPAQDIDRIAQPLSALETTFRPLVEGLSPDLEPSFKFQAEEAE